MTFYRPVAPVLEVYLGQDGVMRSAKAKLPNTDWFAHQENFVCLNVHIRFTRSKFITLGGMLRLVNTITIKLKGFMLGL